MFKPKPIIKLLEDDLYEAQRKHIENLGAAEYYAALAQMYEQRITRLQAQIKAHNQGISDDPDQQRALVHERVRPGHTDLFAAAGSSLHRVATGGAG